MTNVFENVADILEGRDDASPTIQKLNWKTELLRSEYGALKPLLANAITVLTYAPQFSGVIRYDDFSSRTMLMAPAPWDSNAPWIPRPWTSTDDIRTAEWLQRQGIAINANVAAQAVTAVSENYKFHPVADYLDSLEWDGTPRLQNWMTNSLGVPQNAYHRDVGRCSLIAAVARIRQPGSKVDTMPILEGAQGLGKSTLLRTLFRPWYSDEIADLGSKDAAMQLNGAWLIEISELDAMSRADVGRTKAFISRTADRYRPPYGSRVIERPRSCVFWGTTNSDSYLKDDTGGRRFWPVKATKVDIDGIATVRDQLWAEARDRYASGEKWWFQDADVQKSAVEEQQARYVGDPWDQIIGTYVAERSYVTIDEILRDGINLSPGQWGQAEQNRVGRCLRSRGFERYQRRHGDDRVSAYRRPNPS